MTPPRLPDEDSIRARPNPKGSRPRTKERPRHANAVPAQVLTVDRGRYGCLLGGFESPGDDLVITAMKARELGKASIVVGDRVELVGDVTGAEGSLARVVRVADRTSVLRRTADDTDPVERSVVANADQLAVVTALADPEPRFRLLDRCLAAAFDAHLAPLLVLTKADLADPVPVASHYDALDVPWIASARPPGGEGFAPAALEELRQRLAGKVTVLVGHSGVGKSTLVNALVPGADRATGRVNDVTGRGRHTSSSAVALRLPGGGWVVDTPGVRSFGLAHLTPQRLIEAFPDLEAGTDECPRGCSHDESDCALDAYVADGHAGPAGPARLDSFRRLLRSRDGRSEDD